MSSDDSYTLRSDSEEEDFSSSSSEEEQVQQQPRKPKKAKAPLLAPKSIAAYKRYDPEAVKMSAEWVEDFAGDDFTAPEAEASAKFAAEVAGEGGMRDYIDPKGIGFYVSDELGFSKEEINAVRRSLPKTEDLLATSSLLMPPPNLLQSKIFPGFKACVKKFEKLKENELVASVVALGAANNCSNRMVERRANFPGNLATSPAWGIAGTPLANSILGTEKGEETGHVYCYSLSNLEKGLISVVISGDFPTYKSMEEALAFIGRNKDSPWCLVPGLENTKYLITYQFFDQEAFETKTQDLALILIPVLEVPRRDLQDGISFFKPEVQLGRKIMKFFTDRTNLPTIMVLNGPKTSVSNPGDHVELQMSWEDNDKGERCPVVLLRTNGKRLFNLNTGRALEPDSTIENSPNYQWPKTADDYNKKLNYIRRNRPKDFFFWVDDKEEELNLEGVTGEDGHGFLTLKCLNILNIFNITQKPSFKSEVHKNVEASPFLCPDMALSMLEVGIPETSDIKFISLEKQKLILQRLKAKTAYEAKKNEASGGVKRKRGSDGTEAPENSTSRLAPKAFTRQSVFLDLCRVWLARLEGDDSEVGSEEHFCLLQVAMSLTKGGFTGTWSKAYNFAMNPSLCAILTRGKKRMADSADEAGNRDLIFFMGLACGFPLECMLGVRYRESPKEAIPAEAKVRLQNITTRLVVGLKMLKKLDVRSLVSFFDCFWDDATVLTEINVMYACQRAETRYKLAQGILKDNSLSTASPLGGWASVPLDKNVLWGRVKCLFTLFRMHNYTTQGTDFLSKEEQEKIMALRTSFRARMARTTPKTPTAKVSLKGLDMGARCKGSEVSINKLITWAFSRKEAKGDASKGDTPQVSENDMLQLWEEGEEEETYALTGQVTDIKAYRHRQSETQKFNKRVAKAQRDARTPSPAPKTSSKGKAPLKGPQIVKGGSSKKKVKTPPRVVELDDEDYDQEEEEDQEQEDELEAQVEQERERRIRERKEEDEEAAARLMGVMDKAMTRPLPQTSQVSPARMSPPEEMSVDLGATVSEEPEETQRRKKLKKRDVGETSTSQQILMAPPPPQAEPLQTSQSQPQPDEGRAGRKRERSAPLKMKDYYAL